MDPGQVFSPGGRNGSWILPMPAWELWSKLRENYQFEKCFLSFLLGIPLYASSSVPPAPAPWLSHWSCQGREHFTLWPFFAFLWLPRLSFGNFTATSHCRVLDNMELDWLKPMNFPPWNLRMPWGPTADFINLVSRCKSHSCRVAGTSAWFCYSLYTKRKLILKVSKMYTLPVSAYIILSRHGLEM